MNSIMISGLAFSLITDKIWLFDNEIDFNNIELRTHWQRIAEEIDEVDVEEGWMSKTFIIKNEKEHPNKFFAFTLYNNTYEGWSLDNSNPLQKDDIIHLVEVEPVSYIKYIVKDATKQVTNITPVEPAPTDLQDEV